MEYADVKSKKIVTGVIGGLILSGLIIFSPTQSFAEKTETSTPKKLVQIEIAAGDEEDSDNVNDPLEPVNRIIFEFNEAFQAILLRPVADIYNETLPATFRAGVDNFLTNLASPVTVANLLLQGDPEEALRTVGRFMANTVVGFAGFVDVSNELGAPGRTEDFGQTLGVWGVGEGFYLVLPVFGPSSPRDAVAKFVVDPYFDATGNWISSQNSDAADYSLLVVGGISEYAGVVDELDQVRKTSVDYYAAIRSLYRQKRKSEIANGEQLELPPIPDLGYNLDPDSLSSAQ